MKKSMKIVLTSVTIFMAIVVVALAIYFVFKNKSKTQVDSESPAVYLDGDILHINQEIEYNGLKILNFEVEKLDERSCEIRATVQNHTENLIEMQDIAMKLYDKDGNLLSTIGAQVDSVDAGESTTLYAHLRRSSISEIYKIEIGQN